MDLNERIALVEHNLGVMKSFRDNPERKVVYCGTQLKVVPSFYNVAEEKYDIVPEPEMVPLEKSDIVLGRDIVRKIEESDIEELIVTRASRTIDTDSGFKITYADLREDYSISRDGGKTWEKCEKVKS